MLENEPNPSKGEIKSSKMVIKSSANGKINNYMVKLRFTIKLVTYSGKKY